MRWRTYWCVRVLCRRLKKTDVMCLQQAVNALICSRSLMRPVPPLLISAAAELADANDKGRWPTWSAITVDDIRIFRHLWGSYTPPSPSNGARVMGSTRKSEDPEAMEDDEDDGNNEETAEEGREQTDGEAVEDSRRMEGWKAKGKGGKEGEKEQNDANNSSDDGAEERRKKGSMKSRYLDEGMETGTEKEDMMGEGSSARAGRKREHVLEHPAQDVTKRKRMGSGNREETAMVDSTNEMTAEVRPTCALQ